MLFLFYSLLWFIIVFFLPSYVIEKFIKFNMTKEVKNNENDRGKASHQLEFLLLITHGSTLFLTNFIFNWFIRKNFRLSKYLTYNWLNEICTVLCLQILNFSFTIFLCELFLLSGILKLNFWKRNKSLPMSKPIV